MGTIRAVSAREPRAGGEISAVRRLTSRLARAGATEEDVVKESQTVLITLLSCRFMGAITDSA
jgi:hypothetical protein